MTTTKSGRPAVNEAAPESGRLSDAVSTIEADLQRVWAPAEGETADTKVRASTMNLAIVSVASEMDRFRKMADDLAATRGGRAFFLSIDPRLAPWQTASTVAAVCRNDSGDAPVCSDHIDIAFGAMAAARAASVVAALALAEVPTIVELGPQAPDALSGALSRQTDRLIVDSSHTRIVRIAEIALQTTAAIADRAFVRLYSWRDLIARFFDADPELARSIRRVEIGETPAAGTKHPDPGALMLGWLASRLGWRFESATRAVDANAKAVELAVAPDGRSDIGPGVLTSIHLTMAHRGTEIRFGCARTASPRSVRWTASRNGTVDAQHEYPLGYRDETWVMIKAIESSEGDRMYRDAVLAAAEWCRCRGGQAA